MKLLFTIIFIMLCTGIVAQKQTTIYKKTSIGLQFYANYSNRRLQSNLPDDLVQTLRDRTEKGSPGYAAGLNFKRTLSQKIKLDIGLQADWNGYQTKYEDLHWITPNADFPVKSKTKFQYFSVLTPVTVNYYFFGRGRLKYYTIAGASLNLFFQKKQTVVTGFSNGQKESATYLSHSGYNFITCSIIEGFGVEYQYSGCLLINAALLGRQNLVSMTRNDNLKEYMNVLGVNVGVNYLFRKGKR